MKKIYLFLITLILTSVTFGCSFSVTTTSSSTTTNSTTTTETTTTTTDVRNIILDQEFSHLDTVIPTAMIMDYVLPGLQNENLTVTYLFQDTTLIEDSIIPYIPAALDFNATLRVTLFYEDISKTKTYTIMMIRDHDLYEEYMHSQSFTIISQEISEKLPDEIESDFTLPVIDYEGASVRYTSSISRIFNNRFIFSFPISPTVVTITAKITYQGDTRSFDFPVTMKGLNQLSKIPTIYITTDNYQAITSKDYYINATFTLVIYDDDLNPTAIMDSVPIEIRGRGNSTFYMPKQAFRMKFETKTSLLFDYEEKDWVLLANFTDQTLIRNYLAYNFANDINMEFAPSAAFVDVYLNNEYVGNYTLTDQIEVSNDRVDIDEHSTAMDTGYLLELDLRMYDWPEGTENVDWFKIYGVPYVIKSPKTDSEYYTQEQFNYIESYIATVHIALMNGNDYTAYIDESTFIDWFIVEELFKNVDSGYSSVYLYKDKGGLLKMGPVWDFDLSTSNPGYLQDDLRGPEGWYTSLQFKNIWFYYLMKYPNFRLHLKERWNELYDNQIKDLIESVYPISDSIAKSRYENFIRWDIIGKNYEWYTSTEVYNAKTYEEQVKILYDYLLVRSIWMNQEINKF